MCFVKGVGDNAAAHVRDRHKNAYRNMSTWQNEIAMVLGILIFRTIALLFLFNSTVFADGPHAPSTEDLIKVNSIGGFGGAIAISPDGRRVAYRVERPDLESNDYITEWHVVGIEEPVANRSLGDGGEATPLYITDGRRNGVIEPITAAWSSDSRWIAYTVRRDGMTQIWRARADGAVVEQLTDNAADVVDYAWDPSSTKIYFTVGLNRDHLLSRRTAEAKRGFLFDSRFRPVFERRPLSNVRCVPEGMFGVAEACTQVLWVYDLVERVERIASPAEAKIYTDISSLHGVPANFGRTDVTDWTEHGTSGRAVWLEPATSNPNEQAWLKQLIVRYTDGEIEPCLEEKCRIAFVRNSEGIWLSADGREAVILRSEGPARADLGLYVWDMERRSLREVLITKDRLRDCDIGFKYFVCLYDAPTKPVRLVAIDLTDGTIRTIANPNRDFDALKLGRVERLFWSDGSGNSTLGHLAYPVDYHEGRRYPLVIVQYESQGFMRGGTGDEVPIHLLASEGFFVLRYERPRDWVLDKTQVSEQASNWERRYEPALRALHHILDDLEQRKLVDPLRVAITGLSYGAEMVDYALIHSNRFATAISAGSLTNPVFYDIAFSEKLRELFVEKGAGLPGTPDGDAVWPRISIGLNTEKVTAPMLLNVADRELLYIVPNFSALYYADKPVEMHVFPDEYHVKWQPIHRYNVYRRNTQWLKFWLQREEVDDPVDPEQYIRWRKLRAQHETNLAKQGSSSRPER